MKDERVLIEDNIKKKNEREPENLKVLCFDLTYYNKTTQFLLCTLGVFSLYIVYGYLQELIFSFKDFKPFSWFLTLLQFFYYIVFAVIERRIDGSFRKTRCIPMKTYVLLAGLTLGTMGLSNSSLAFLNYPTQVIFKCCKLVPVLIGSILIQGKKHGPYEFLAAVTMCIGLAWFTLADSKISPNFNMFGVMMISGALLCDAAIGNVQEKAMKEYKAPNNEVVLFSYGLGFCYLLVVMIMSENLISSIQFCNRYPKETYVYAFLFSLTGYLGMQFVLTLVRTTGAPLAATVTTCRKAVTIVISFVLFAKPFSIQYLLSGLVVVIGIALNVYSKKSKLTFYELKKMWRFRLYTKRKNFLIDV